MNAIHLNHASAEMDYLVPTGVQSPRIQVPEIPKGPIILNHIKLDNSVVGALNTGTVNSIDVTVSVLQDAGNKQLSEALTALVEAIANSPQLDLLTARKTKR